MTRPRALVAALGLLLASCGQKQCGSSGATPPAAPSAAGSTSAAPLGSPASAAPDTSGDAAPSSAGSPSAGSPSANPFAALGAPAAANLASRHPAGVVLVAAQLEASGTIAGEPARDVRDAYLEGHGDQIEGVFDDQRGFFRRVEGKLGDEGAFALREAGDAAGEVLLRGRLQGGQLTGSYPVSQASAATHFEPLVVALPFRVAPVGKLAGRSPALPAFAGMLADRPVMVRLDGMRALVRGQMLLPDGQLHDLEGSFDEARGRLSLTEKDGDRAVGQLSALVTSSTGLTGRYDPAPGSAARGGYLALRQSIGRFPLPLVVAPRVTLRPRASLFFGRSCVLERVVPVLAGEPSAGLEALNQAMAGLFTGAPGEKDGILCDERALSPAATRLFVDAQDFRPAALAPGLFALTVDAYQDTNGAHGNGVSTCHLADLASGRLVELRTLVDGDRGRAGLTRLAEASFRREMKVTDLTKAGFFSDATPVRETTNLCVEEGKLRILFEPYEVGPYSFGRPSVDLDPLSVKGYLTADPLAAAVIGALAAR